MCLVFLREVKFMGIIQLPQGKWYSNVNLHHIISFIDMFACFSYCFRSHNTTTGELIRKLLLLFDLLSLLYS